MVWLRKIVVASSALFLFAGGAASQSAPKRVRYKVGCPTCAIEFTPVATFGGRNDTVSISPFSSLDRDSQGRFFAIGDNFQVLVYDARGRLLKTLGRRGDGPGEFNSRNSLPGIKDVVIGPADSVFVFHPPKVTVYSPQLVYVRTISPLPFSRVQSIHSLPDGTWLIAGESRAPEHGGRSTFIVNPDATIRRSIGPGRVPNAERPTPRVALFYVPPDGRSIWYAEELRYSFSQWSIDGRHLGAVEIDDTPFLPEPKPVTRRSTRGVPFETREGGVALVNGIDTTGLVWVWARGPGLKPEDALLEVIDPQTGEIHVSQKATKPVRLLPRGDLAYSWTTDDDGFMTAIVSTYRFVRR